MRWNEKTFRLLEMLADPGDRRPRQEKSAAAGLHEKTVYAYLKEPEFLHALHKRTTELVAADRPRIYGNLARDSDKGDTQAGIAYLKGCGDIQGGVNVQTNVTQQNSGEAFERRIGDMAEFRRTRTADARRATLADRD